MKDSSIDETSKGLNQLLDILNAKGDEGELKEIADLSSSQSAGEKKEDE